MDGSAQGENVDCRTIEQLIRSALTAAGVEDIESLRGEDDLFEAGLTSVMMVELLLGIEDDLSIEIPDDMLTRDHFRSIFALTELARSCAGRPS